MREFIRQYLSSYPNPDYGYDQYLASATATTTSDKRMGAMHGKILNHRGFKDSQELAGRPWLGGMCIVRARDFEWLKDPANGIDSLRKFEEWFALTHPRLDQLHDTIGVPPGDCRDIYYVVEDSFYGKPLARTCRSRPEHITGVIREVHQRQGLPLLERWLRSYGCRAKLHVVYSSEVERELDLLLRMWERKSGERVAPADRNDKLCGAMYSSDWLDVLGIRGKAVVAEPYLYSILHQRMNYDHRDPAHPAFLGFFPWWTSDGTTRELAWSHPKVVHRDNWRDATKVLEGEDPWLQINMGFSGRDPLAKPFAQALARAEVEIRELYEEQKAQAA